MHTNFILVAISLTDKAHKLKTGLCFLLDYFIVYNNSVVVIATYTYTTVLCIKYYVCCMCTVVLFSE